MVINIDTAAFETTFVVVEKAVFDFSFGNTRQESKVVGATGTECAFAQQDGSARVLVHLAVSQVPLARDSNSAFSALTRSSMCLISASHFLKSLILLDFSRRHCKASF